MAVEFQAYVDGTSGSSVHDIDINLSGRSVGELALVFISVASDHVPDVLPEGWETLLSMQPTGINWWCGLFAKVLTADDLTTVRWTYTLGYWSKTQSHAVLYRGAKPSDPVGQVTSWYGGDGYDPIECGALTSNETTLAAFGAAYRTSAASFTSPEGWTERRDHGDTASDIYQFIADTAGAWEGGESDPSFTLSASVIYRTGTQVELVAEGAGGIPVHSDHYMRRRAA